MNEANPTWEELVSDLAEMEWPDRTPDGLLACSFQVDRGEKLVTLAFHCDAEPSAEEHDELSDVEGGILAHLPEDWQTRVEFQLLRPGEAPHLLSGGVIYRREDAQTPDQRWRDRKGRRDG